MNEETEALRIPRTLVLHPKITHEKLCHGLHVNDEYETLCPKEWILLYLLIQRILSEKTTKGPTMELLGAHVPYIRLFPCNMLTPLHFSTSELSLLEGTTLYHGALQRREASKLSSKRAKDWLISAMTSTSDDQVKLLLTWTEELDWHSLWLWAEDGYASRSFPPQVAGWPQDDEPILIPGFDALNHRRAEPVTWSFREPGLAVFTFRRAYSQGEQVYNNYGAKSNEELCGSYGFVEPNGPDDLLVLALRSNADDATHVFYWPQNQLDPPASLLVTLGEHIEPAAGTGRIAQLLSEVQVMEMLEKMLRQRRKAFRFMQREVDDAVPYNNGSDFVREGVLFMIRTYRDGQASMLNKKIQWVQAKLDRLLDELEKEGWTP